MNRLADGLAGLDLRGRIVAGLAALALIIAVVGLSRIANAPGMVLLYSGLDGRAAGGVVSALEARGVHYEVRGDAIFAPEGMRDALRMSLAGEGLPANGAAGYELLDGMSGFGTTSQMFDAAYWRAKEGELSRTILATQGVRLARVHIANPRSRPFERGTEPSASVTVSMAAGGMAAQQAQAIRYLVASAVAGLRPDAVSVVDAENGVILRAGETGGGAAGDPAARAATLRANVERLLEARVGPGRAVVEVTVDHEMDAETVTERVLDPESRVAIHSDSSESSESETGGSAAVTVASNLPDGDAGGGDRSSANRSETRERFNYEVSEVLRERVRRPGRVRRISVAVLVDGVVTTDASGAETWAPRPEEELTALEALVRSAVGFEESRGDVVTLRTLRFSSPPGRGADVQSAGAVDFLSRNLMGLIQLVVMALVALILGLFVLRPLLSGGRGAGAAPSAPAALTGPETTQAAGEVEAPQPMGGVAALPGGAGGDAPGLPAPEPDMLPGSAFEPLDAFPMGGGMGAGGGPDIDALRAAISDRGEDSVDVLKDWLTPGRGPGADPARGGAA